jgi:hypothetical protein
VRTLRALRVSPPSENPVEIDEAANPKIRLPSKFKAMALLDRIGGTGVHQRHSSCGFASETLADLLRDIGAQNTKDAQPKPVPPFFADPGETPCLFAMQWLSSSPPSVTQMQQVWHHHTAQRGARPLGDTVELGKDTVSLHDLRTCCNWLALYVLALLLETPLKLVPPPGFFLLLLVDFIPVPVETSFYMTSNFPSMMPSYPLAF